MAYLCGIGLGGKTQLGAKLNTLFLRDSLADFLVPPVDDPCGEYEAERGD